MVYIFTYYWLLVINICSFIWIYISLFIVFSFGFVLLLGLFLDNFYIVINPSFFLKSQIPEKPVFRIFLLYFGIFFFFIGFFFSFSDISPSSLLIGWCTRSFAKTQLPSSVSFILFTNLTNHNLENCLFCRYNLWHHISYTLLSYQ